jgi:hypothetical protein
LMKKEKAKEWGIPEDKVLVVKILGEHTCYWHAINKTEFSKGKGS